MKATRLTMRHLTGEQLNAYIDGECNEHERNEVAAHIEMCAECARDLKQFAAIKQLFGAMPEVHVPRSFVLPAEFAGASSGANPITPTVAGLSGTNIRRFEPFARLLSIAAVLAFLLLGGGQMAGWIGDDSDISNDIVPTSETANPASALQEEEPAMARGVLREQGDAAAAGAGTLISQPARVDTPVQVDNDLTPLEITTIGIGVIALVAIASWILIHYRAGSAG